MYTRKGIFFAAALMLLAACQAEIQEAISEEINETEEMVVAPAITAVQEPQTKTLLEVDGEGIGTIYWKPGDEINVFYGTTSTHYVSQNDANATTAVFTTTDIIGIGEGAATNIWGLYPYNSSATCTGSAVTTTLPATQYGVPGTFDDDLFITLAHNNSTALTFYNVCGGIKFSLSRDDITSITFRGNNNEDIAGDITVDFVNDLPHVGVTSGQKEITLTPKQGGAFTSGENYYLIVLPVTLTSGFTMTFSTTDGSTGTLNYSSNAISIKRSVFGRKTNIDSDAFFRLPIPYNQIWYTSTNGSIVTPYSSDGFGANIISNVYVDGKGIITFDGDVTSIGTRAFQQCNTLSSIYLPGSVTSIESLAFMYDNNLQSIYIPDSVNEIAMAAIYGCNALSSLYIPDSVSSIGSSAFYSLQGLTSIRLPRGLTIIKSGLFYGCNSLSSILIPSGVTTIEHQAFFNCSSLTSIDIPEGVTEVTDNMFSGCTGLKSITFHGHISSIGAFAYRNCTSLSSLVIQEDVITIGRSAFIGCSGLTTISVPAGVTSIGLDAFKDCSGLSSITIYPTEPPVLVKPYDPYDNGTFDNTNNCPIYVPAGSVEAYKSAEFWSDYADRIQAIP